MVLCTWLLTNAFQWVCMLSHNFNIVFNYFVELVLVLLIIFSAPFKDHFQSLVLYQLCDAKNVIFFVEYVFHCVQNTALFKYATELSVGTPSHTHNTLLLQVEKEDERKKKDSGRAHEVELLKTLSCNCSLLLQTQVVKVSIYKVRHYTVMQSLSLLATASTTSHYYYHAAKLQLLLYTIVFAAQH